jgi:ABC-type transporter Mla subunit MlaD
MLPSVALGLAVVLLAGGCGSDDEDSPQPYLDQARLAAAALDDAGKGVTKAAGLLAGEANAARLGPVTDSLDDAAALVAESAQHVDAAIAAAGEEGDAGRDALEAADRAAMQAADAGRLANEQLLDAAERLDIPYEKLVSPETDQALDEASDAINTASTEVVGAVAQAE